MRRWPSWPHRLLDHDFPSGRGGVCIADSVGAIGAGRFASDGPGSRLITLEASVMADMEVVQTGAAVSTGSETAGSGTADKDIEAKEKFIQGSNPARLPLSRAFLTMI